MSKNVIGGTLWDFLTSIVLQSLKKLKGDPLVESKKLKKSRIVLKKIRVKNTKGAGILCYRGFGLLDVSVFVLDEVSGVSSLFWRSVVKVDDVEQMNKKVDITR